MGTALVERLESGDDLSHLIKSIGNVGSWIKRDWTNGRVVVDVCAENGGVAIFPEEVYYTNPDGSVGGIKPCYRNSLFPNGCCISGCGQPFESIDAFARYCD